MAVTRDFFVAAITRAARRPVLALVGPVVVALAGAAAPAAAAPARPAAHAALPALAPAGLYTWGNEIFGDLGNGVNGGIPGFGGQLMQADTPVSIPLPASVRQLVAYGQDGMALLSNGTVANWGDNGAGQLGDGTQNIRTTPFVISGLAGITQIAGGGPAIFFASDGHEMALDSAGTVWVWGDNSSGEAGNGTTGGDVLTSQRVPGLSGVVQIAAGSESDYALKSDGTVWAWGYNGSGQLGDDTTLNRLYPSQVGTLSGITKIAAGDLVAYAIRADGSVMAWGDNSDGLLGNGTDTGFASVPVQVPGLTGATQISASGYATLVLAGSSGTVWAWGGNYDGELGDGTTVTRYSPEQTGLTGVSQISEGEDVSAAVLSGGSVLTWGENDVGELGDGGNDSNPHPSPAPVRPLAGGTLVSAGSYYAMAVASPAPRIPSVIDDSQAEAAQVLQADGYVLGRVSTVVDLTCQYLGVVKTQSPAADTIDPPGTVVNIAIGRPGGKCL
jgi:alpha-tubulin suppressor-like RCC1 family protein